VKVVWDDAKNAANLKKHGISFEEASVLFTEGGDYYESLTKNTPTTKTGSSRSVQSREASCS
jgi:uncharacterized DUF497 family protein